MASPPFNPNEALPGDTDVASGYPAVERAFRDIIESWLLIEHGRSGHHAIPNLTTSARNAVTNWETGSLIYNTSTNRLQHSVTPGAANFVDVGGPGSEFAAGTRMLFQQDSAPTGWTKETNATHHDAMIVNFATSGIGVGYAAGTAASSAFAARTILQANLPNVNFSVNTSSLVVQFATANAATGSSTVTASAAATDAISNQPTGTLSGTATAASGGSGTAMDFNSKRVYTIVAQRN